MDLSFGRDCALQFKREEEREKKLLIANSELVDYNSFLWGGELHRQGFFWQDLIKLFLLLAKIIMQQETCHEYRIATLCCTQLVLCGENTALDPEVRTILSVHRICYWHRNPSIHFTKVLKLVSAFERLSGLFTQQLSCFLSVTFVFQCLDCGV